MRTILTLICCLAIFYSTAQNQSNTGLGTAKYFDGPYLGVNIGTQNVFGGSFVNEMDILAQQSKVVTEFTLGYRTQLVKNRLVAGIAFSMGFLDGSLEHNDETEPLNISYKTSFQSSIGTKIGIALGKQRRYLIFGYINETKRKFDVAINQPPYEFTQRDKQGMLKYGIGVELNLKKRINISTTFGGLRVDFGDLETNIDVEDKYDLTIGLNYQF
jgi:hypothetical protein